MRTSALPAITIAALMVLSGCAGFAGTDSGDSGPSPDEFPDASEIDESVFDAHAATMANTNFTLTVEETRKDRNFSFTNMTYSDNNFTYMNGTSQFLVEPDDSQYLANHDGYFWGGEAPTIYSNGSTPHGLWQYDNESATELTRYETFNESSDRYLWGGWFDYSSGTELKSTAINATFEREGVETFQGASVMRYEATGVDALPEGAADGNASSVFEDFSATLLLDTDGVVRQYSYEFVWTDYTTRRATETYTLSDVGSTDVEIPDVVANATAGS